ncbi:hypothetical protein QH639_19550 [Lysinibacillus sp. 1 U-2021]|nr:hypothetical protein [Lysinibacillus sp. 1 U-2021]WGT37999.1 hypothetical protein QH639_19550 [Lysinibacillus sp. 1 U-2021]
MSFASLYEHKGNKAAQSSKTYGVNLEQLVGYTTAIGAATRE